MIEHAHCRAFIAAGAQGARVVREVQRRIGGEGRFHRDRCRRKIRSIDIGLRFVEAVDRCDRFDEVDGTLRLAACDQLVDGKTHDDDVRLGASPVFRFRELVDGAMPRLCDSAVRHIAVDGGRNLNYVVTPCRECTR